MSTLVDMLQPLPLTADSFRWLDLRAAGYRCADNSAQTVPRSMIALCALDPRRQVYHQAAAATRATAKTSLELFEEPLNRPSLSSEMLPCHVR